MTYSMTGSTAATITPFIGKWMGVSSRTWGVTRTPSGANRWEWFATGPRGSQRGFAHSKAVAEVRAKRAYEELAT